MTQRRGLFVAVVALLLAGCGRIAPASAPPQLDATPGPPVVFTDAIYSTTIFSLRYPATWRVITSASFAPPSVVLVRPDEAALFVFSTAPLDAVPPVPNPLGPQVIEQVTLRLPDGTAVYAALSAPGAEIEPMRRQFEAVADSLSPPPT